MKAPLAAPAAAEGGPSLDSTKLSQPCVQLTSTRLTSAYLPSVLDSANKP